MTVRTVYIEGENTKWSLRAKSDEDTADFKIREDMATREVSDAGIAYWSIKIPQDELAELFALLGKLYKP